MYKKIILGPFIFEDISLNSDELLFAGEWCKLNIEHDKYKVFSYPLNNQNEWRNAKSKSSEIYLKSLKIVKEFLNEIHDLDLDIRYWEVTNNLFLSFLSDIIADKIILFNNINNQFNDIEAITLDEEFDISINNLKDFVSNSRVNDLFHWQISSIIWKKLNYKYVDADHKLINRCRTSFQAEEINYDINRNRKNDNKFRNLFLKIYKYIPESKIVFYMTLMNKKAVILMFLLSGFKIGSLFLQKEEFIKTRNNLLRKKLMEHNINSSIEKIICKLLSKYLPLSQIENYKYYLDLANERIKNKGIPKFIVTGWGELKSELFLIWSAECIKKGTRFFRVQHGGGPGELVGDEEKIIKTSLRYLTWGWESNKFFNAKSFLSLRLLCSKPLFLNTRKNKIKKILWIGSSDSKFCYQLAPRPISSQYMEYFNNQLIFAKSIKYKISKKFMFRPSFEDLGWDYKNNINEISKYVEIDNFEESLDQLVHKYSLIIVDYMGSTPFPQILNLDIPCILVNLSSYTELTDEAKEIYEKLESVGIYYPSSEKLINKMNQVISEIPYWWKIKNRKKIIKEYLNLFGSTKSLKKSLGSILN